MFNAALRGGHREEEGADEFVKTVVVRCALPRRVIAVVHPREMGRTTVSGRTAAEATIGTTRGVR